MMAMERCEGRVGMKCSMTFEAERIFYLYVIFYFCFGFFSFLFGIADLLNQLRMSRKIRFTRRQRRGSVKRRKSNRASTLLRRMGMRKGKYSRRRGGVFGQCMKSSDVVESTVADQSTLHTDISNPNYITRSNLKQIFEDAFVNHHRINYIEWPSDMLQLPSVGLRFTPQSQVFIKFGDKVARLIRIKVPAKNHIHILKTKPLNEYKLDEYLTIDIEHQQYRATFEIMLYVIVYEYIEEEELNAYEYIEEEELNAYECTIELFDNPGTPVRAFHEAKMNTSQPYNAELWDSKIEQPELIIAQQFTKKDKKTIQSYIT